MQKPIKRSRDATQSRLNNGRENVRHTPYDFDKIAFPVAAFCFACAVRNRVHVPSICLLSGSHDCGYSTAVCRFHTTTHRRKIRRVTHEQSCGCCGGGCQRCHGSAHQPGIAAAAVRIVITITLLLPCPHNTICRSRSRTSRMTMLLLLRRRMIPLPRPPTPNEPAHAAVVTTARHSPTRDRSRLCHWNSPAQRAWIQLPVATRFTFWKASASTTTKSMDSATAACELRLLMTKSAEKSCGSVTCV